MLVLLSTFLFLTFRSLFLSRLPLVPWLTSELLRFLPLLVHLIQIISGRFEVILTRFIIFKLLIRFIRLEAAEILQFTN